MKTVKVEFELIFHHPEFEEDDMGDIINSANFEAMILENLTIHIDYIKYSRLEMNNVKVEEI
jgi:hypothetical protein